MRRGSTVVNNLSIAATRVFSGSSAYNASKHGALGLTNTLREEEKADAEVRKKITSQKKEILEGSEEWDVLYRKYYLDELRRMGIAAAPDERRSQTSSR